MTCPVNCKPPYYGAADSQTRAFAFPRFGVKNAEFRYSNMPDVIVSLLIAFSYFIENTNTHTPNIRVLLLSER